MSARTPFVPSRTASRASNNQLENGAPAAPSSVNESFRPNGLLGVPANRDEKTPSNSETQNNSSVDNHVAPLMSMVNKPLNLSGLAKKNPAQQQSGHNQAPGKSRKSFEDVNTSSRSPKAFLPNQQALRISAPRPSSPFFPSSTGFVTMNGFRAPSLPVSSKLQSASSTDDFSSNQAHIPTLLSSSTRETSQSAEFSQESNRPPDRSSYPASYHPSALMQSRARTASQPSLEKIHETAEEGENEINGASDGSHLDRSRDQGMDDGDESGGQQTLRRTSKRVERMSDDEDDELGYNARAKRYKADKITVSRIHFSICGDAHMTICCMCSARLH